jgi:hypothetical protein
MKLTRRQEDFISNMVELTQKFDCPVHYSVLAEHLGVSPFTAYDMLRLLEDKGLVTSEYQLASDKTGPGRAERVFYPTEMALERRQRLSEEAGGEIKKFILERMRKNDLPSQDLVEEMLARIPPEGQGPIRYCVEVMTIVALHLRGSSGRGTFQDYLPEILAGKGPTCRANLSLLGGFSFGILSTECSDDQEWVGKLFEHVGHYLDIVSKMRPEDCHQLGDYLGDVFMPLTEEQAR